MEKLKLDLDGLRVDGFVTAPAGSDREAIAATIRCTTTCTEIGSCGHICP